MRILQLISGLSLAAADIQNMDDMFQQLSKLYDLPTQADFDTDSSAIEATRRFNQPFTMDRFFVDTSILDGYGCWCRIHEYSHGTGKGAPIDIYDEYCMNLHKATDCIFMDFGVECTPWDTHYSFGVTNNGGIDCYKNNENDPCRENLCKVESTFVIGIVEQILNFNGPRLEHAKFNPNHESFDENLGFNYRDSCKGLGRGIFGKFRVKLN